MDNQPAILTDEETAWRTALSDLARQLGQAGMRYTVVGGACLALRGLPIRVKDVDIEMDAETFYRCVDLWAAHLVGTAGYSSSERYRSHFGRFLFGTTQVEVMAGLEWQEDERWLPVHTSTAEPLDLDGVPVNVSWLEEEMLAYIRRGRLDRAALCLEHCDRSRLLRLLRGQQVTRVLG